jgi:hypothetical protein
MGHTALTSQAARFLRVFLFALLPSILTLATGQTPVTIAAVAAFVAAALEVAWRAIHPTVAAATPPAPPAPPTEPFRPV